MRFRPLNNYLTVKPTQMEVDKTEGGLFLPDSAKEHSQIGTVLEVGEGIIDKKGQRRAPRVKTGDKILFFRHSGFHLEVDPTTGEKVLLMGEADVLATL